MEVTVGSVGYIAMPTTRRESTVRLLKTQCNLGLLIINSRLSISSVGYFIA